MLITLVVVTRKFFILCPDCLQLFGTLDITSSKMLYKKTMLGKSVTKALQYYTRKIYHIYLDNGNIAFIIFIYLVDSFLRKKAMSSLFFYAVYQVV